MKQAHRFSGKGQPYEGLTELGKHGPRWTGRARFVPEMLDAPLRWKKPRRVFVNSMSDLFHEDITDGQVLAVFDVMRRCPQHTFQILTKRPERMLEWFRRWADLSGEPNEPQMARGPAATRAAHPSPRGQMFAEYLETLGSEPPSACAWPTFDWMHGMRWLSAQAMTLPNVWLGVSAEDQQRADERIPILLQCPAAVRFVSLEPLLGPINLRPWLGLECTHEDAGWEPDTNAVICRECDNATHLDWVIVGGESGPGARPCDVEWIRSIVRQCRDAGTAVFVKQLGSRSRTGVHYEEENGVEAHWFERLKDRKGGDIAEFPDDLKVRQFPEAHA